MSRIWQFHKGKDKTVKSAVGFEIWSAKIRSGLQVAKDYVKTSTLGVKTTEQQVLAGSTHCIIISKQIKVTTYLPLKQAKDDNRDSSLCCGSAG